MFFGVWRRGVELNRENPASMAGRFCNWIESLNSSLGYKKLLLCSSQSRIWQDKIKNVGIDGSWFCWVSPKCRCDGGHVSVETRTCLPRCSLPIPTYSAHSTASLLLSSPSSVHAFPPQNRIELGHVFSRFSFPNIKMWTASTVCFLVFPSSWKALRSSPWLLCVWSPDVRLHVRRDLRKV